MSGGSFNYLCWADASDIFSKRMDMELMQVALEDAGYIEAASATKELRTDLRRIEAEIQANIDKLANIWHAMEWYRSGDWSQAQLDDEAAAFKSTNGQSMIQK